jgi:hypothetical protein
MPMRDPRIDERVRLTKDIPEPSLQRGQVGVIRSIWFAPEDSYEVEFRRTGAAWPTRCVLSARQVELEAEQPAEL